MKMMMALDERKNLSAAEIEAVKASGKRQVLATGTVLVAFTSLYWNGYFGSSSVRPIASATDRLLFAVRLSVFSLLPVFVSLFHVVVCRVSNPSALNPLSGNEHHVEKANRILANTLEQIILHLVNLAVFAVVTPPSGTFLIPYLVGVFTVGRLVFWAGYTLSPYRRPPGFVLTFWPTMGVFIYNLVQVASGGAFL